MGNKPRDPNDIDPEDLGDAQEAEEVGDKPSSSQPSSQLDDSLHDLQSLFGGLAAKLLGPKATRDLEIDPEKPVISPEVDRVIDEIGSSFGKMLTEAGEAMRRSVKKEEADAAEEPLDPEPEGWSPLVMGARTFVSGLSAVATDLAGKVSNPSSPPSEPQGEE